MHEGLCCIKSMSLDYDYLGLSRVGSVVDYSIQVCQYFLLQPLYLLFSQHGGLILDAYVVLGALVFIQSCHSIILKPTANLSPNIIPIFFVCVHVYGLWLKVNLVINMNVPSCSFPCSDNQRLLFHQRNMMKECTDLV